ncbi:MAG: CD225/dispanin family protein [Victivallales bacterium]
MNCSNCGNNIGDGKKFCTQCGTPVTLKADSSSMDAYKEGELSGNAMFCKKCGTQNDKNSYKCSKCLAFLHETGATGKQTTAKKDIPNYLIPSILVTIFCCWPVGIPAIIFAAQVNSKLAAGDYNGAVIASGKAKLFTIIAVISGFIVILFSSCCLIFGGIMAGDSQTDSGNTSTTPYAIR